jgi:hypothetical protein
VANNDFAVVVGIRGYPYLSELDGPIDDAHAFEAWLLGPGKVPDSNLHRIFGDSQIGQDPKPVADDIDDAFAKIFDAIQACIPRRLYFYFAGHGCAEQARHVLLLMANAREGLLGRGLNAQKYHERLASLGQFPEQLFFYDCCRNYDKEALAGREPPWDNQDPGPYVDKVSQFILYGAAFTQFANERKLFGGQNDSIYSTKRGLFTQALVDGLGGGAASEHGVVTADRLAPFVQARLEQLATKEGLHQDIVREYLGSEHEIVLAEGLEPWKSKVQVNGPPGTFGLSIRDSKLKDLEPVPCVGDKATLELVPGQYEITALPSRQARLMEVKPLTGAVIDFGEA